jgi:uncharacterized protein
MLKPIFVAVATSLVLQASSYRADVEKFRKERAADIGGETGWASLTDLAWTKKTDHTIGRGAKNDVILKAPSAPERLGTIDVGDNTIALHVAAGVAAKVKGQPVTNVELKPNISPADGVSVGDVTMVAIKRGNRIGLRVWDRQALTRRAFAGLKWYPIDAKWHVEATFVPHQPVGTIKIQNIIGDLIDMPNPGTAVFTIGGQKYELEALLESDDADELFFMFKDGTSNKTTYGAGRYLYTPLPKNGKVTIDFNRAMNPPCAFTNFATCPLPPAKNRLSLAITAGELDHKIPH